MKILIIAITQSIHSYRWINQLKNSGHKVYVYCPSNYNSPVFRDYSWCDGWYDNKLRKRTQKKFDKIRFSADRFFQRKKYGKLSFDNYSLLKEIECIQPDLIHSMALQDSAYPVLEIRNLILAQGKMPKWLATNWGSDIYFWQHDKYHNPKILDVLKYCDYYSCENKRDLRMAQGLGLKGKGFEPFPNTGGLNLNIVEKYRGALPSKRKVIFLKGYNSQWGRASVGLRALERCIPEIKGGGYEIVIHNPQMLMDYLAKNFEDKYGIKVTLMDYVEHEEMLEMYGKSRIHIGLSISDGNATSLLESIAMGTFPIQSDTAAVDEWFEDGESGYAVPAEDVDVIADRVKKALVDDELVDRAYELNWETTQRCLDYNVVKSKTLDLYKTIENDIKTESGV